MNFNAVAPALVLAAVLARPAVGLAQDTDQGPATYTGNCHVLNVATFSNRVHVECASGAYFRFFASPTSASSEANRLVTLGSAAMTGAGYLQIRFQMSTSDAASYGCMQDCRRPLEVILRK